MNKIKNISQCYDKIRRSDSEKITQCLNIIKVSFCDLKGRTLFKDEFKFS